MLAIDFSDGHKPCSKCKVRRPLSEFPKSSKAASGRKPDCHPCRAKKYAETQMPPRMARRHSDLIAGLKECTKCGVRKELAAFPRRSSTKCGVKSHCLVCHNSATATQRNTVEGKAQSRARAAAYNQTEVARTIFRANALRSGAANPARAQRYEDLVVAFGVARERLASVRATPEGRLKYRARAAVQNAVESGTLQRGECAHLDNRCSGRIHGHHESYLQEHWLDVVWLCHAHHMIVHRKG